MILKFQLMVVSGGAPPWTALHWSADRHTQPTLCICEFLRYYQSDHLPTQSSKPPAHCGLFESPSSSSDWSVSGVSCAASAGHLVSWLTIL